MSVQNSEVEPWALVPPPKKKSKKKDKENLGQAHLQFIGTSEHVMPLGNEKENKGITDIRKALDKPAYRNECSYLLEIFRHNT